jgi:hypothetical protein
VSLAHTVTVTFEDEEQASFDKLKDAGYRSVLWWTKGNTYCNTGSALKNVEIQNKRDACRHVRNGPTDYCLYCEAVMPWTGT